MNRVFLLSLLCISCWPLAHASAGDPSLQIFPLSDVKLTAGPFLHAQLVDLKYVMSLDPDRLLAPYRREAAIPSDVESYGSRVPLAISLCCHSVLIVAKPSLPVRMWTM